MSDKRCLGPRARARLNDELKRKSIIHASASGGENDSTVVSTVSSPGTSSRASGAGNDLVGDSTVAPPGYSSGVSGNSPAPVKKTFDLVGDSTVAPADYSSGVSGNSPAPVKKTLVLYIFLP